MSTDVTATTPSWWEVFQAFLILGFTSFGGPVAHLGYFRDEFVTRRQWLSDAAYADLVALCQFLPGPASSQVGFSLGLLRGGWLGALMAWLAFTLPSALLLILLAMSAGWFGGSVGQGILHGLKLVAVAVVAQAVWGMARSLCPDRERATIAVLAVALVILLPSAFGQIGAIMAGGLIGLRVCRSLPPSTQSTLLIPVSRPVALICLALFAAGLVLLPLWAAAAGHAGLQLFDVFYRAGALVFGGGHVVLPLLETGLVTPGWVSADQFLAGYGLTQAMPGPLFTFSAYLGYVTEPGGWSVALLCLVAIFVPGFLLLLGALPFWGTLRQTPRAQSAMAGANAAVVGILGAALYDPVWTSAVQFRGDFAIALAAFVLLTAWKLAPWKVVVLTALAGALSTLA